MASLITRTDGAVGTIVISNPAKYNAMTLAMWQQLPSAIAAFDADPEVRLIVLEGDGDKAFVSGSDISQFESQRSGPQGPQRYNAAVEAAHLAPGHCSKPVLAKIRGVCFGGGVGLAASCDVRMCSRSSRFRIPAARIGIGYPRVGIARLLPLIGPQNTYDILLSARTFSAEEAQHMGFVMRVGADADFDAEVAAWAALVVGNAPLTLRAVKRALISVQEHGAAAPDQETDAAIAACFSSEDYREGTRAFMEKRVPAFRGR